MYCYEYFVGVGMESKLAFECMRSVGYRLGRGVFPFGEYKEVAAWLSVSVGMGAVKRLFLGCGELFYFVFGECKGRVRPSVFV